MGNNGSSHHQIASGGPERGRGWTQSFPRELARHHSQPGGRKVLPEPPNQRLRATNNGSIIHNGGTISGRRPPALTLPHDLNKGGFRTRSSSASNMADPRNRMMDRHCCYRLSDIDHMRETKRFGSEPDLRCSPSMDRRVVGRQARPDHRRSNGYYQAERDTRERPENRYRGKKKYKAPAPPTNTGEGSSPEDAYKWDVARESRCRVEEDPGQPPPRRSRLFKTRAETKKIQVNWHSSSSSSSSALPHQRRPENERTESDGRWKNDCASKENERPGWHDAERPREHHERWYNRPDPKRTKLFDGKNTLQRSMSSPEFQAELIQVARKVRDKLNCNRKSAAPIVEAIKYRSLDRHAECERQTSMEEESERLAKSQREIAYEEHRTEDKFISRVHEDKHGRIERCLARESETTTLEEHADFANKSRSTEKVTSFNEEVRKPLRERLEVLGRSLETRLSSDKRKSDHSEMLEQRRTVEHLKNGKCSDSASPTGTDESEPPIAQFVRDKLDIRGWHTGKINASERMEGTGKDKENSDPRWWKEDLKGGGRKDKRWSENINPENLAPRTKASFPEDSQPAEEHAENWHGHASPEKSTPKTFYFGMNEPTSKETRLPAEEPADIQIQSRLQVRESSRSPTRISDDTDDGKNIIEDISLKLRPTLPKKQLEIPRFSPSAAWRLLSALEAPGPTASTASEEMPVMFEERIERLSRPPPPLIALGPRSLHDKSGDSGISGDAGAPNEDSVDVSTTNRVKVSGTARPAWTPQQDLGEESSSDAGVDSPPPMPTPLKFPTRPHVFSLSLPREEHRTYIYNAELKGKDNSAFNSLQKLKRSVSGALGLCAPDLERKRTRGQLDDNWLLSTSAPTSLQHNHVSDVIRTPQPVWKPSFKDDDDDGHDADEDERHGNLENRRRSRERNNLDADEDGPADEDEEEAEDRGGFPVIMKPPSFSYLASGGHVMYLPESNDVEYRAQSMSGRRIDSSKDKLAIYRKKESSDATQSARNRSSCSNARGKSGDRESRDSRTSSREAAEKLSNFSKSRESLAEMRQRSDSPTADRQIPESGEPKDSKAQPKNSSKGRRFTFQSTVRQIERRRLAEKLSREAEAKERQRRGELEAMRKVEEEFQRKRAREKANIRQQLRLYSMEENLNSLPGAWESPQISRADPDGAPSSTASSPISAPTGNHTNPRKNSVSSDEYRRKRTSSSDSRQHHRREQSYRPKYYDWGPDSSSHLDYKQTTVHPKVVCDIPKSSPAFVDAGNAHTGKAANANTTPRSDNYRKDFAHGAVAGKSSLASSDSELSQPNTRPHSRQTSSKSKPVRSRSGSPEPSEGEASSGEESPVQPVKRDRKPMHDFILNGVQPFVREKSYRPISFNPQPPPPIPS